MQQGTPHWIQTFFHHPEAGSFWRVLLLGNGILAALIAMTTAVTMFLSFELNLVYFLVVLILVAFPLTVLLLHTLKDNAFFLFFPIIVLMALGARYYESELKSAAALVSDSAAVVRGVYVDDVLNHPNAIAFYFQNALVIHQMWGLHEYSLNTRSAAGGNNKTTKQVYVAPVIPTDWKLSRSIHVWALYDTENEYYRSSARFGNREWKLPHKAGVRVTNPELIDSGKRAVQSLLTQYKITPGEHPVFIRWVAHPEQYIEQKLQVYKWLCISWLLLFSLALVILRLRGALK